MKTLDRSTVVRQRLKECLENNEVDFQDEVQIFELLLRRLKPKTRTSYGKMVGKTYNGVNYLRNNMMIYVTDIDGKEFVIDEKNK